MFSFHTLLSHLLYDRHLKLFSHLSLLNYPSLSSRLSVECKRLCRNRISIMHGQFDPLFSTTDFQLNRHHQQLKEFSFYHSYLLKLKFFYLNFKCFYIKQNVIACFSGKLSRTADIFKQM